MEETLSFEAYMLATYEQTWNLYYIKNQQDATLAVLFISTARLINNTAKVASCWFSHNIELRCTETQT